MIETIENKRRRPVLIATKCEGAAIASASEKSRAEDDDETREAKAKRDPSTTDGTTRCASERKSVPSFAQDDEQQQTLRLRRAPSQLARYAIIRRARRARVKAKRVTGAMRARREGCPVIRDAVLVFSFRRALSSRLRL